MIIQKNDQSQFNQEAWRIRKQVSKILTKWGLLPRFKRWRLARDPDTGMIVLFGILNNKYIATHTSIPFSNYFDPSLLNDLASELQIQVVSCNSDGLRYAFVLDRGQLGKLPTHIDFPFIDNGKMLVRVVYGEIPPVPPAPPVPPVEAALVDDHKLVHEGVGAFLKVFDDIKLRDDEAQQQTAQELPDIVVIDANEFHKRVAEHEANWQRSKHIKELFGNSTKEQSQ
ncbi:MAG: hypothetical protein ABI904_03060 [Chloroflexota bacterium]